MGLQVTNQWTYNSEVHNIDIDTLCFQFPLIAKLFPVQCANYCAHFAHQTAFGRFMFTTSLCLQMEMIIL